MFAVVKDPFVTDLGCNVMLIRTCAVRKAVAGAMHVGSFTDILHLGLSSVRSRATMHCCCKLVAWARLYQACRRLRWSGGSHQRTVASGVTVAAVPSRGSGSSRPCRYSRPSTCGTIQPSLQHHREATWGFCVPTGSACSNRTG